MKRNTLTTAVLAGLTGMAGMVSVSNAVNVNPDGLGQVLLYPYYSARGGNDTLISIVNTTERGKAVKIRFIEALNSREVLDFNIYMSPYDVWTAAITAEGEGAKMQTADTTCTAPYFYDDEVEFGEEAFLDFAFSGDGGPQEIERTASGYIEVIEMGTMLPQVDAVDDPSSPNFVQWASKHVSGSPRNCDALEAFWLDGGAWDQNSDFGFEEPSGGLFGAGLIVNPLDGTMFTYNATAIDGFWGAGTLEHSDPASLTPSLSSGPDEEAISNVFVGGNVVSHDWSGSPIGSLGAVNAVLTFDEVFNEYNIESVGPEDSFRSEWVVTFPTKRFHADVAQAGVTANDPLPPFTNTWHVTADGAFNAPCEALTRRFWDREEGEPTEATGTVIPSPPPPTPDPDVFELCSEANVIRFTQEGTTPDFTEIFGEPLRDGPFRELGYQNFDFSDFDLDFDNGWVRFDFGTIPSVVGGGFRDSFAGVNIATEASEVVRGLPTIGFYATSLSGTPEGGFTANYGGTFNHRGSRNIQPAEIAD